MNFQLKGAGGFHISDHNREYVDSLMHRIEKFEEHIEHLTITIHKEAEHLHEVTADIHFHWKIHSHISHDTRELYPGIEHLFEEITQKCRREHSKHIDHHRGNNQKHTPHF